MNDLGSDSGVRLGQRGGGDHGIENRRNPRSRRRRGGRALALGGFLLLAAGLSIGVWGNYSRHEEVRVAAKRERDSVPILRVARIEASPAILPVTLPGTTAAFAAANIYARATGYIDKRNVDIGDRVKGGDLLAQLAVPPDRKDPDFAERSDAQSAQVGIGAGGGELKTRAGNLGPG